MSNSQIEIYQTDDGLTRIDVHMDEDTVWLTQAQMVELFQSSKANISEHIATFLTITSLSRNQLFGISEQLPLTVNHIIQSITILI